ncbi:unnamed protein product [Chrysoparadoxa australica]
MANVQESTTKKRLSRQQSSPVGNAPTPRDLRARSRSISEVRVPQLDPVAEPQVPMAVLFAASKWVAAARSAGRRTTISLENDWDEKIRLIDSRGDREYTALETGVDALTETNGEEEALGDWGVLKDMLWDKWINVCLIFVPLAVASKWLEWGDTAVFCLNFMAMLPLASMLGDFTEELAAHTNQTLGGLINATFGNAVEVVVVALQALAVNEIRVVQASLIGSVFSNLLLVLGCCFFFGGIRHKEQRFNSTSAVANCSLLLLSSLALVLPTPLSTSSDGEQILLISRFSGVCLLVMYVQLLFFQLRSHAHLFEDDDEAEPALSLATSIIGLGAVTVAIAILSEYLVGSIDGFTQHANLSKTFVGIILLPIIGNAVEHVTAVTVAMKNKMELAMGVAVGSATQISMFVVPVTVLSGWAMKRDMTLAFPAEEVVLYLMSIIIVTASLSGGSSNWLQGSLLITTYVLIGLAFWVGEPDKPDLMAP